MVGSPSLPLSLDLLMVSPRSAGQVGSWEQGCALIPHFPSDRHYSNTESVKKSPMSETDIGTLLRRAKILRPTPTRFGKSCGLSRKALRTTPWLRAVATPFLRRCKTDFLLEWFVLNLPRDSLSARSADNSHRHTPIGLLWRRRHSRNR